MNVEIFDLLESCIIVFDIEKRIVYANKNAIMHFDVKLKDDIRSIFQSDDRVVFFDNLMDILNKEGLYKNFIRLLDKNKKVQFCYINGFKNSDSYVFEIIVLSGFNKLGLSQRNLNYNYLKYISQGIAHVLRNPIMSISGFLNLIRKKLPNDMKNDIEPYLEYIQGEFSKIMKIVLDIEIINNVSDLKLEKVNINDFLHSAFENFRLENTLKPIQYRYQFDCGLDLYIDKKLFGLVLEEILKNAYESIEEKGNIFMYCQKEGNNVLINIEDNGGGIDKERLGMLFTPFYSTKPKNIGLGLFISKLIMQAHRGRLRVISKNNTTTVKLILPIEKRSKMRIERLSVV
ncbi:sensory transduction protein kinase [Desulfurella amilsii]|uniref:histidine kinase n=1 Tax=Desulfurella amilsii TaxID=1562698 RepID=A0A1X4XWC1_9BACT|nr:ATP-binding protein [Desulfurella amilsii]OSS41830.1 sensory transduction protein kinase [Desulfurella amilsii]